MPLILAKKAKTVPSPVQTALLNCFQEEFYQSASRIGSWCSVIRSISLAKTFFINSFVSLYFVDMFS